MIDSRLGGLRTNAKAAPWKETPYRSKAVLRLPDLDQAESGVLNSLTSADARRGYRHAIDEFVEWYCSEPRLSFNRTVVMRYRIHLEARKLAPERISVVSIRSATHVCTADPKRAVPLNVAMTRRATGANGCRPGARELNRALSLPVNQSLSFPIRRLPASSRRTMTPAKCYSPTSVASSMRSSRGQVRAIGPSQKGLVLSLFRR